MSVASSARASCIFLPPTTTPLLQQVTTSAAFQQNHNKSKVFASQKDRVPKYFWASKQTRQAHNSRSSKSPTVNKDLGIFLLRPEKIRNEQL